LIEYSDKKFLVVIPAYNEGENIEFVISELKEHMPFVDILVVNDHSSDDTGEKAAKLNIKCLNLCVNLGYSSAVQTGILYADRNKYDYVLQFDADGQHMAIEAQRLIDHLIKTDADIVIGSRYLESNNFKQSFFRMLGTKLFSRIVKLSTGKSITDPTSGFQILTKRVIGSYAHMDGFPEYPDANLIIAMFKRGYSIEEIPVSMRPRRAGKSMHDGIIGPVKYVAVMLYSVLLILFKRRGLN